MTDDVKKVVAWLRRTAGGVPHLETLLAHIDGEPARLAAAREEQREACAEYATERHAAYGWEDREVRSIGIAVRATPLTATPLADEIAALRARVAELERQREGMLMGGVTTEARAQLERAEKAEARLYSGLRHALRNVGKR